MTNIRLADPYDFGKIDPLVAGYSDEFGLGLDDGMRERALMPLLQGSPLGVIYLIGPPSAPVGYAIVTFSWSIPHGGLQAILEQIFMRDKVRGRGMGRETLNKICVMLRENGVASLSLFLPKHDPRLERFLSSVGFERHDSHGLMSQTF